MAKKKIVMFHPMPVESAYFGGLPLALMKTASMLDRNKFSIHIVKATDKFDYKKKIATLCKDALCFTVSSMTGYQIENNIDVIKLVKKANPKIPIIWGGYHPSILPEETLKSKWCDAVVIGQGERTFLELCEALAAGKNLEGIKGIGYKDKNGKIIMNEFRMFENMNNFPQIPFDLVNVGDNVYMQDGKRTINYVTSMGCPFRCGFCAEPMVSKRRWSGLKPETVVKDLEFLVHNYGVEHFVFPDNNFFVDPERVRGICNLIIEKKLNITWSNANGRTKQLLMFDNELWKLIEKSGCRNILIGAESGMQEILDLIHKDASVDDTINIVKVAKKHNIKLTFSLMIGFPREKRRTKKEILADLRTELKYLLNLIDKCYPERDYYEVFLFVYTPYPGNDLFELAKRDGFTPPNTLEGWASFDTSFNNLPWMPEEFYGIVSHLMDFVFPYAAIDWKTKHTEKFQLIQTIFHKTARWRLKTRFFGIPIENIILQQWRKMKSKKQSEISNM